MKKPDNQITDVLLRLPARKSGAIAALARRFAWHRDPADAVLLAGLIGRDDWLQWVYRIGAEP